MSNFDFSKLISAYQSRRVDCPFKDECRDYLRLCDQCANNRALKKSFFRPKRWFKA